MKRLFERLRSSRLTARLRDEESGQAAVEYAMMSAYLLVFVGAASPWVIRFAPEMLNALQIYMDGFYFSLAMPLP